MTIPGGFAPGDVLSATDMNLLPAGVRGYAQVTASQTGIGSITDLTSLTVTFTAVANRRYKVTGFCNVQRTAAAPAPAVLLLREGSTVLAATSADIARLDSAASPEPGVSFTLTYCNNASVSGSKTWKLSLAGSDADATAVQDHVKMIASSTYPAFILVEDIGPL